MSNINLSTIAEERNDGSPLNASILTAAVVLVALVAVYGAIIWLGNKKVAETETVNKEYTTEYAKLTSNRNRDIVDFQNRIIIAKDSLGQANGALDGLSNMEKTVVGGAYFTLFDYDKSAKTISIAGLADNYDIFAQQILNFKKLDYISEVNIGKSNIDDKGSVSFSLVLNVK